MRGHYQYVNGYPSVKYFDVQSWDTYILAININTKNTMHSEYDAIIIGSGMGGLTCGVLLTKLYGQRVLILEKHHTLGGLTQVFSRADGYKWDVGLHYLGYMGEGQPARKLMDFMTEGNVDWHPMPDPYEVFIYPDYTIKVGADQEAYIHQLVSYFPEEAEAIRRYFKDIRKAGAQTAFQIMKQGMPHLLSGIISFFQRFVHNYGLETTQAYFDQHFRNEKLKAILASQWGDYGLPPRLSAFGIHALIVRFFSEGAYYPVGGADSLAKSISPVIEANGGTLCTNHEVFEILTENQEAIGVKVNIPHKESPVTFHAPTIISDAGALNTYLNLIARPFDLPFSEELKALPRGHSAVTLYLGLKESPAKLGIRGENHWIYEDYRHNDWDSHDEALMLGNPKQSFLSFPSMKDPQSTVHTAEIVHFVDHQYFEQWENTKVMQRGDEYQALKQKISRGLIRLVDRHLPGFAELVAYQELATPLTFENFTNWPSGAFYGIPAVPQRYQQPWLKAETPIKNLYLTGSDVASLGIMGACMGGILATAAVMDKYVFEVFKGMRE